MTEKKAEAGEYIYHEGDTADVAYNVISGQVELLELNDGREVQTGLIVAGQVFGELAVFSPSILRSHSARVMEPATIIIMTPEEFQGHVAQCPAPILPFLKRAFERMKSSRVKQKASLANAVLEIDITKITVAPASDTLKGAFKPIEVPLTRLPFRIGGYPEGGTVSRRDQLHLSIAAQDNPLRVSRQHCEITIQNKSVVISDLGSRFCTKVNNSIIGRGRGTFTAPLKKGANEVTLGALDGPYKLTVTCA